MVYQSRGTAQKSVQHIAGIQSLKPVKQAGYDVMPAGSLSSRKDYAYVHLTMLRVVVVCLESNDRHTVSVREQRLYRLSVRNGFCGLPIYGFYILVQNQGHPWFVSSPCYLQCTLHTY